MAAVHLISSTCESAGREIASTRCGLQGFPTRGGRREFDTATGGRFEAVRLADLAEVTCKRCGRESWGTVRRSDR